MGTEVEPQLLTPGRLAERVKQPLSRVQYILRTREHIKPFARAGALRLYAESAVALIQEELQAIRSQRGRRIGKQKPLAVFNG